MSKKFNRRDFLASSGATLAAASALPLLGGSAFGAGAEVEAFADLAQVANQAMPNLQKQWYNAVVAGLQLDPNLFQLFQTGNPLLTDNSNDLWQICDAVPPNSITHQFNPSQYNKFFEDYNGVITALAIPQLGSFEAALGPTYYQAWLTYKLTHADKILNAADPMKAQAALYRGWAAVYLDPAKARTTLSQLEAIIADPMGRALDAIQLKGPNAGDQPSYNVTIQDVITKMASGATARVQLDSSSSSSDISHTWAKAEVGGIFGFFFGHGGGSYDHLSQKATSERVTVDATFTGVIPLPVAPGGWYNSGVFGNAFHSPNDPGVWNPQANVNWDKTFGPNGNIQRLATTLRIASGYKARITSYASYSENERTTIMSDASMGFWPFFSASGSGGSDV
ncbi:MAG: hypothetical protein KDA66_20335, partial [Planctomycetaceae bacterium]|nr:hypothetical protein [Planctomycetaceae bacterium]